MPKDEATRTVTSGPSTTYLVSQVHHALRTLTEAALKPYAVTGIQFTVLSVLEHRDGLSSADLSRRFYVTPQSMGQLLSTLEDRGFLERKEDASNRRILRVSLTAAGRNLVTAGSNEITQLENMAFASLSHNELQSFRAILQPLVQRLREQSGQS